MEGKLNKTIAVFDGKKIRRIWDETQEAWYFSVVDVVGVLAERLILGSIGINWRKDYAKKEVRW